jgi:hypothetical protein
MRSHYLNVKNFDYRSQTRIIPAKYDSPIPVWGQNDYQSHTFTADTFATEKLRRFCLEYPLTLCTPPTLRSHPGWFKTPLRAIAFIGIGTTLGFSIPTSPSHLMQPQGVGIPPSGALDVEVTPSADLLSNSLSFKGKPGGVSRVAFAGVRQSRFSWVNSRGSLSPSFVLPVEGYPVTSGFGNRVHPIFGDTRFHNGIDLGTPMGTPIQASAPGYVSYADWNGGYGKTVIIQHVGGYETLYAHLDQVKVKVGDRVKNGQIIGLSGSTGYVTGPHLHFEIRRNQIAYNPLDYL